MWAGLNLWLILNKAISKYELDKSFFDYNIIAIIEESYSLDIKTLFIKVKTDDINVKE